MVAAQIVYGFTSDLSPTSVSPGWSSSAPITEVGAGTIAVTAAVMQNVAGTTSQSQTTIYWTFTFGPDDVNQAWTPQQMSVRAKRTHTSTSQGLRVRTSADSFAANVYSFFGLTSSFVTHAIDLSGLGEITGPLTIRVYPNAGSTGAWLDFDDLTLDAVYTPAGAADQTVSPAALASSEAFGVPVLVLGPRAVVVGIPSAEAFGTPSLSSYVPEALVVFPEGLPSDEAFGVPVVFVRTEGAVALPTGEDVAAFLDAPGHADLVTLAGVHVGVITEFARIYTRGNGFHVDGVAEPLAGVILAATARLASNPEQLDIQVGSVRRASFFKGWSLAEQRVLNNYRGVAQ